MSTAAARHVDGPELQAIAHARRGDGGEGVDVSGLERDLRVAIEGEVRFDAGTRAAYAHDASNYRQPPIGVVVPRGVDDVVAAVDTARAHGAPVLPRGCGTSLAGQSCNVALVIDCSKYMRDVVEVDLERRLARVQPGCVRDDLCDPLEAEHHVTFAPDTSTHTHATLGGMVGNNSCGVHSVMAGRTADNVHELEVLTYDGLRLRVGSTSEEELEAIVAAGGRRGEIYAALRNLRDRYADLVRRRYPDIPRRVSGYNLDELLPERGFHVGRALVGSEGTCVTVLEATLELVHSPPARSLLVLGYPDVYHAADHVTEIREHGPIGLEGMDHELISDMRRKGMHGTELPMLPDGRGYLLVEFGADTQEEADERARECMRRLRKERDAPAMRLFDDPDQEDVLWQIREDGLGATAYIPGERDSWEGWEDAAVPPSELGAYLREFRELLKDFGYRGALYGHFGDGCVHTRITFELQSRGGVRDYRRFVERAADLVVAHGGSLSGEHGDGQSRAELLEKMYGPELVAAFREFKAIWDPEGRMNPHKVVDPYPLDSNLKLGPSYNPPQPATHFAYPQDGGSFAHAALRCVGVGKCRDVHSGTMCPSYMATHEEEHSTRGRARILFEMLRGEVIEDGWRSQEVHDALDLCLSCKGCKAECPVNVDMATYKAEFLSRHYRRRLRPREAYSMGLIMAHARVAQHAPALANALARAPGVGGLLKRLAGISPHRALPPFPARSFTSWFAQRGERNPAGEPVVLFPDTFNNFLHPETMRATLEVLESTGRRVVVPQGAVCCGRPLYDYGMLDTARRFWRRTLDVLRRDVRAGTPVVGVEPSCVAAFRDELVGLLPHDEDAKRLSLQTLTLGEFLTEHGDGWEPPVLHRRALVHGHCHHEAVMGLDADRRVLDRLGLDAEVLDSGCCGMAGSFGFEARHHDISVAIGERRLLPAVREAPPDTLVVADGFSCKTQVEQLTERRALHLAQVVRMAAEHGPDGPAGNAPERLYPDVEPAGRASRRR